MTAVLRISWAHPQFGQVIASCSLDNTLMVWEERESVDDRTGSVGSDWINKARLSDSRAAVNDVAFAPRHNGLMLAAASADGLLRLYTANDQQELAVWDRWDEFAALDGGAPLTCLAWNPGRFDAPTLVVGGEAPHLAVWAYSASFRKWTRLCILPTGGLVTNDVAWAPNAGRSYHLIAAACRDAAAPGRGAATLTDSGLASGTVSLWRLTMDADDEDDFDEDEDGAGEAAGGAGASSSSSATTEAVDRAAGPGAAEADGEFRAVDGVRAAQECIICSSAAGDCPEVWRLRWGVVGSLLATTGDDGIVRLWRRRLTGKWSCAQEFSVSGEAADGFEGHGAAAAALGATA